MLAFLWSIVLWVLGDYGYIQTAHDLIANRGVVVKVLGYVLLSPVSGVVICASCLGAYLWMERRGNPTSSPSGESEQSAAQTGETETDGPLKEALVQVQLRAAYDYNDTMAENRAFTPRTALELADLARIKPSHKAEQELKPHLGLWLNVRGLVADVKRQDKYVIVEVVLRWTGGPTRIPLTVSLWFRENYREVVLALDPHRDQIEVNGRIRNVRSHSIQLHPCELVAYGPRDGVTPGVTFG